MKQKRSIWNIPVDIFIIAIGIMIITAWNIIFKKDKPSYGKQ